MPVVITKNPAFWAPGFLVIPDADGTITFEFRCRFKRLPSERQAELIDLIEKNRAALRDGKPALLTDKQLLDEVQVDWEGFKDENREVVIYSEANRAQACADWFGLEAAMVRSFLNHAWPEQRKKDAAKN